MDHRIGDFDDSLLLGNERNMKTSTLWSGESYRKEILKNNY